MTSPNVGEWVPVETADAPGRLRADYGSLCLDGLSWAYLSAAQWEAAKAAGDAALAGMRGRKAATLADSTTARLDLAVDVAACLPEFPGLLSMTDSDWARVARVLRDLDGSFPLLRDLWEQAGRELEEGR